MKFLTVFPFVILLSLLNGCAGNAPISAADKAHISSIYIDPAITVPEDMWYTGPEATFGVIGLLVEKSTAKTEDKIIALAQKNDIHIDKILYNELRKQLSLSPTFTVVDNQASDATLSVDIVIYGLTLPHGFSSKLVPILRYTTTLNDATGKQIWKQTEHVVLKDVGGATADQINEDPAILKRLWGEAAASGAKHTAENLK